MSEQRHLGKCKHFFSTLFVVSRIYKKLNIDYLWQQFILTELPLIFIMSLARDDPNVLQFVNIIYKSRAHFLIKIPSLFLLVAYLLLGIWYTTYLRSTDLNDTISIVALALSIASSGLAKTISSLYYKIVIKIITRTKKSKGA